MNFGQALEQMKQGSHVRRPGWAEGLYVGLHIPDGKIQPELPYFVNSAGGHWGPSSEDLLATDWVVLA